MTSQTSNRITGNLYLKVTDITEEYLGPAAERFLARQITSHLGKPPGQLTPEDLPTLIKWTRLTLGLLTEDHKLIDEYERKMTQLL